uniref:Beclin 1 n=1 Tax=Schistosoma japonicum TaxID=6182 RepID=Q4A1K5_SCHJA|nr:beclin 1 [Schistosoma japonicum]
MSQQTSTFTIGSHIGASNSNSLASPISYQLVCQRCFNPLQLDHDFEHLQKTELMTLIDATTTDSETSDSINLVPVRNSTAPRPRFIVPPNSALSLLNDDENPLETLHSYAGPTSSLDHRLKVNACLFDVLSGRTEVDHPLCQECADTLLLAKQQCLEFQEEELKCLQFYLSYLDSIAGTVEAKLKSKQSKKYGKNVNELEATLSALQSNLNELLLENDKLDKQIIQDTAELEKRTEELDRATTQYNDQKLALIEAEEEMQCLESRLSYARSHLHRLQRTNVLNIAFPIWYDGHIGVINGLHLGRLPNRPVGWEEINAAWGQCALLLQCIGKKLNYSFQSYLIVPMGSQSKVVQLSISKEFPLYYTTGGMRILSAGKFDTAMINFLDCLNQAQQIIEHTSSIQLPFRIKDKGKIQDPDGQIYSIRWNGNSEENWTKALKMMLINMKWIIAALSAKKNKKATVPISRNTNI